MQRWIPILAVAFCAQLAAAVMLDMRHDRLVPQVPETPLVSGDLNAVDRLILDGPVSPDAAKADAARVELVKRDGQWALPGYFDAPADGSKVQDLLQRLASVKRGLPIATTDAALARFKVAADQYERRIAASANGKAVSTVYLGSSPGLRKADARTAKDRAVYAVAMATYDLPTAADKWLDAGLLDKEANGLTEITLNPAGKSAVTLRRDDGEGKGSWKLAEVPAEKRLDGDRAAALAKAVADVKIDAVLGKEAKPEWRLDQPELGLALKGKDGKTVNWTLSKPEKGGYYVLKSSDQPWYLHLEASNARPLLDATAEDKLVVAAEAPAVDKDGQSPAPMAHAVAAGHTHIN